VSKIEDRRVVVQSSNSHDISNIDSISDEKMETPMSEDKLSQIQYSNLHSSKSGRSLHFNEEFPAEQF